MKTIPMIFNTEMVKALLGGRKTVTRRLMKPQPEDSGLGYMWWPSNHCQSMIQIDNFKDREGCLRGLISECCPHGSVGDLIWVRETFCIGRIGTYDSGHPASDYDYVDDVAINHGGYAISKAFCEMERIDTEEVKWTPSIHMPRWASRLTLRVTDVRIEQIQDITEEQAKAEGAFCSNVNEFHNAASPSYCRAFKNIWNSIYSNWNENPYVWVIEFEVINKNVDEVE